MIERQMIQAIIERKDWRKGNTRVEVNSDSIGIYLFENKIATYFPESMDLTIDACGWRTATTKSRLNALMSFVGGAGVYQLNFDWFISVPGQPDREWSGELVAV